MSTPNACLTWPRTYDVCKGFVDRLAAMLDGRVDQVVRIDGDVLEWNEQRRNVQEAMKHGVFVTLGMQPIETGDVSALGNAVSDVLPLEVGVIRRITGRTNYLEDIAVADDAMDYVRHGIFFPWPEKHTLGIAKIQMGGAFPFTIDSPGAQPVPMWAVRRIPLDAWVVPVKT